MTQIIETVDPALLIEANEAVSKNRDKGADSTVVLVGHFHKRLKPEVILAIQYHMLALANIVQEGASSNYVISEKGKEYKLVNEAMFRAAAITPLSIGEDQIVAAIAFERDLFLKNALSETEPDGSA